MNTKAAADHPYADAPDRAFWNRTISGEPPERIGGWYRPKFPIGDMRVATAGSCFAQHIGRGLRERGFAYVDTEPPPRTLAAEHRPAYGYGIYSARYGNVYTSRQLLQLVERATGAFRPDVAAWERDGGVVDPFRPTIQPEPYATVAEMEQDRAIHLELVLEALEQTDLFVFTFGLTETWEARSDGAVFPLAPGVAGGRYDPRTVAFRNLGFAEVLDDMERVVRLIRSIRPQMHFLFTVSPVPLAATASGEQVAVATGYSKSVLRAVAGELAARHGRIDYFPSYEIIAAPAMRGTFYAEDARTVLPRGVDHVMSVFFGAHPPPAATSAPEEPARDAFAVACDEELLLAERDGA